MFWGLLAEILAKMFFPSNLQGELSNFGKFTYIIGHNYHGHYLNAGGLSVNNYVRENKVREVNVRE